MRAAVLTGSSLKFQQELAPSPRDKSVEIQVLSAGICETDLQLVKGYMGFEGVLGHEFVGIAQSGKFAGQRVAGEINCSCGSCDECDRGDPNHCPHRSVLGILNHDGAFADRVWLPEENLHPIPDCVSNDEAVFIEPLAAAFQIPAQLNVLQFERAVVLGDGRLGNLCSQVLKIKGCQPLVIGKHRDKLAKLERLEIETTLLDEVKETRFADLVVDCTGSPTGMLTAFKLIKPRGTIVLKSTFADNNDLNLAPVVIDELNIIGSRCGPFSDAILALVDKQVDVQSLITSRFPLNEVEKAFLTASAKDQMKVLLDINS